MSHQYIKGEGCQTCGRQASHKIAEEVEPGAMFHPYTAYLCCFHFAAAMGPVVAENCGNPIQEKAILWAHHDPKVEEPWRETWRDILLRPDGTIDIPQLKKELSDYSFILRNVGKVYDHVTMGRLSKAHYEAGVVIAEADDVATEYSHMHVAEGKAEGLHLAADIALEHPEATAKQIAEMCDAAADQIEKAVNHK